MNKQDWSFQDDAVNNLLKEFKNNPYSKNLLVIPPGGGKTITAVKTISKLIDQGILDKEKRAIWATHLKQLKAQTIGVISSKDNIKKHRFRKDISKFLEVEMVTAAKRKLTRDRKYKLLIIDEAHHSAANSYKNFFNTNIGILGLTATPTRSDEVQLDFDKNAYEITFAELIKRNIIIKPKFIPINTGEKIYANNLNILNEEMDKFDNLLRNQKIAKAIFINKDKYKKVIVFVGSINHIKNLYEVIKTENKSRANPYQHIGYIYGGGNEKGVKNDSYIKWHKKIKSSILINCNVLSEGYDDPMINTVVMAVPTKSALRYIQCIGRVVRNPLDQGEHNIYVVEMVDELPNINYRIDNKWLFADISEYLEPIILEEEYYDKKSLYKKINEIFKVHNVDKKYIPKNNPIKDGEYLRVLLFTANNLVDDNSTWRSIIITEKNKNHYLNIFNELSNNIDKYYKKSSLYVLGKLGIKKNDKYFKSRIFASDFMAALNKAYKEKSNNIKINRLKYIVFNKKERVVDKINKKNNFKKLELEHIKIDIKNLLLDPNNPRFCKHEDEMVIDERIFDKDIQKDTFKKMMNPIFHFDILELAKAIKNKGFVNVDNVFVRKIKNKYLVIEGNRRITAVKFLLKEHESGKRNSQLNKDILKDIKIIDCIDLTQKSKSDIDYILGLRHHGSIMPWGLLPSSFSIYNKYMEEFCKEEMHDMNVPEAFAFDKNIAGRVGIQNSMELKDVITKLRAYRTYLQLREMTTDPELQKRFTIIHDALKNKKFRDRFEFDEISCTFSDNGAERFLRLIIGTKDFERVIWGSRGGEHTLTDYLYILKHGTPKDIERVEKDGESILSVKSDLKSRENVRDLYHHLEYALNELEKIKLGEDFEGLGEHEKEILIEIQKIIDKINILSKKKTQR